MGFSGPVVLGLATWGPVSRAGRPRNGRGWRRGSALLGRGVRGRRLGLESRKGSRKGMRGFWGGGFLCCWSLERGSGV